MSNEDHRSSPATHEPSRRYLLPSALVAAVIVGVTVLVIARDDKPAATSPSAASPPATTAPTMKSVPDTRSEIVVRLREILQIREQAFSERDASLFDGVYTSTCPCLQAGRDAIAALKKEHIRWQDRSISIDVQSVKSISKRLWEVVAFFISDAFRIETEDGKLVRQAPAERLRYRFLLVRNSNSDTWRLGAAAPIQGG
jgi:hypothetical protein